MFKFAFHNFASPFLFLAFLISVLLGLFLFWRSAKRDLVEDQVIFDSFFVFLTGCALGRVTDFLVRFDYFRFSLTKLLFFNIFPGFDFFGGFAGGLLAVYVYLRAKKQNFWFIFDYAASSLAFGVFFFKLWQFFIYKFLLKTHNISWWLVAIFGYLFIFWTLKRLEKKKKHRGFFICFFMVSFSILNLITIVLAKNLQKVEFWYVLSLMAFGLLFFSTSWYILAKRKLKVDLKNIFAGSLLLLFKTKRVLTNIHEADTLAKGIVLAPLLVAKLVYFLVKYLGRELMSSLKDMLSAFGV